MEFLFIWVLFVIAATAVGSSKGRGVMGFFLGAFFGLVGLLVMFMVSAKEYPCPYCGYSVSMGTTICKYCKERLDSPEFDK